MRFQVGDKVRICKNIESILRNQEWFQGRWLDAYLPAMKDKEVFTIDKVSSSENGIELDDFDYGCNENELRLVQRD